MFFCSTYKTYSRIDFFLVSSGLVSMIQNCWYETILLSDHTPVILLIKFPNYYSSPLPFRFQAKWLKSAEFEEFLEGKIMEYFNFNKDQTSASIKLEAFKAYIRGEIMSYTQHKSKIHLNKLKDIDKQIKELQDHSITVMTLKNI